MWIQKKKKKKLKLKLPCDSAIPLVGVCPNKTIISKKKTKKKKQNKNKTR